MLTMGAGGLASVIEYYGHGLTGPSAMDRHVIANMGEELGATPDGHAVEGSSNYGQGSSREHAALAPRYLGLRVVLARKFARIHGQNLVNFVILPLEFMHPAEYDQLDSGDILVLRDLREKLPQGHIS